MQDLLDYYLNIDKIQTRCSSCELKTIQRRLWLISTTNPKILTIGVFRNENTSCVSERTKISCEDSYFTLIQLETLMNISTF